MHFFVECALLAALWVLYWTCHDRRRYLQQRIGEQAFKNVYQVGRNVCFMLRRKELQIQGDLRPLDGGCVLYSFHFGVWELMPFTLNKLGYRIGILVNKYRAEDGSVRTGIMDFLLRRWRAMNGVKVFYRENVLGIVRFLRAGGVFGMLVDGNDFFQKYDKASKLAKLGGVPLVPFAAYRRVGGGRLHIGCDIPVLIRAMPLDYVWFYRSR
jgi:lauroyl/myristoyl acyltransferase